jgi:L-malate glycosyltransferase
MERTVLVLQGQVPPYRIPFFRSLTHELKRRQFKLLVVSSSVLPGINDIGFLHQHVRRSAGSLSALKFIYQKMPTVLVLPHSLQYFPLASSTRLIQRNRRRQLFWGMGTVRRYGLGSARDRSPASETVRRLMLALCDHYLSYTEFSTANLLGGGYDGVRITTLNNSVEALATPKQVMAAKRVPLQVLFVASLVEDKEPLTAVAIIGRLQQMVPGATLHIVGSGPLRGECERAANAQPWVHFHGPLRGQTLRDLALTSDIAIIPGRVGLAVLELASAGLPLATCAMSLHGAEIAYLRDGINGLFLSTNTDLAAKKLGTLLADRPALERMRNDALKMANEYSVRNMAINFANGVLTSLA